MEDKGLINTQNDHIGKGIIQRSQLEIQRKFTKCFEKY